MELTAKEMRDETPDRERNFRECSNFLIPTVVIALAALAIQQKFYPDYELPWPESLSARNFSAPSGGASSVTLPSWQPPKIGVPRIPNFDAPAIPLGPGEIFPEALAKGCNIDPRTLLQEIEGAMQARRPFNKLYILDTPEGTIRMRVIVRYDGQMTLGFLTSPAGIGFFHDGPGSPVRDAFKQALDLLGKKHNLSVRANISVGRYGGCQLIDDLARY